MKFELVATEFFIEQIKDLDRKSKDQINEKIGLISSDPFRFKRIRSKTMHNVFRVRLNLPSKEMRLIYAVLSQNIILVCLLNRESDYTDLEKCLQELK